MAFTRNTDGFTSLPSGHPLQDVDFQNPLKWSLFMEDFLAYDIGQAAGNPYTLTATNCTDTITSPNGLLTLTLGGADNDGGELQLTESPFALVANKRLFLQFRARLTLAATGTVAANEIFIGLGTEQTTTNFMAAAGTSLTVDNALGFVKYDAGAAFGGVMRASDVESNDSGLITPTDGGWFTGAIYYTGTEARFFAGTAADGSDFALKATLTANDPTAAMTPTIWFKGGEAKANVLAVDYFLIASER